MIIKPLSQDMIPAVITLMDLGAPFITTRTHAEYWFYAQLFSSSCPIAIDNGELVGAVIAFRSQDDPGDVYIQDVMVHPHHRRKGVAQALIEFVAVQATAWGCGRLYLTSDPHNTVAHRSWPMMGFANLIGDRSINGVSVITDFKGPGKTRAVYERRIR